MQQRTRGILGHWGSSTGLRRTPQIRACMSHLAPTPSILEQTSCLACEVGQSVFLPTRILPHCQKAQGTHLAVSCCPQDEELREFLLLSNILQNTSPHTQVFQRCEGSDLGGATQHSPPLPHPNGNRGGGTLTCRGHHAHQQTQWAPVRSCVCVFYLCSNPF